MIKIFLMYLFLYGEDPEDPEGLAFDLYSGIAFKA